MYLVMEVEEQEPPLPEGECEDDADCDDGLFCTGAEQCIDSSCVEGPEPCRAEGQVCVEEAGQCWELVLIEAERAGMRQSLRRPVVQQERCVRVMLACGTTHHADADTSTVTVECADTGGSGVTLSETESPLAQGSYLMIPICIAQNATRGVWTMRVETIVEEDGIIKDEIIQVDFEVR